MINTEQFKNKKVLVAGLARSGLSVANLLYGLGAKVWATDNKDDESVRINAGKIRSKEIKIELGRHSEEFIKGKDLVIVSPGLPSTSLPVVWAKKFKIPLISEIELAWRLCPAQVIAVTGSNGKTTVTTLIGKIIEKAGRRVFVLGNIGTPFTAQVERIGKDDLVSLEVSSFQLEGTARFKPKVSVVLNLSRNHLDWHKDMAEYTAAKKRIFMNQDKSDYLVLNGENRQVREFGKEAKAKVIYFSSSAGLNPNQEAVAAVGQILGIDKKLILEVFAGFKGLEHRMEYVRQIKGINFINDSKSTTADSTLWALKNIPSQAVLICGGKDKGVDYGLIRDLARKKVRQAILIGQAQDKIAAALEGVVGLERAGSLEEAVHKARLEAKSGDCVLLSPMCSSFDMFKDYEDRGRAFKKAVMELTGNG